MSKTVLGVFENTSQAERAVDDLQRQGFNRKEISIVARNPRSAGVTDPEVTWKPAGYFRWITTGVPWRGCRTASRSRALAIPGLGPIVAAGPIAASAGRLPGHRLED